MKNKLINIEVKEGKQLVSARELHEFLEIKTDFRKWFPRMCEYGFENGVDYTPVKKVHPMNNQEYFDYAIEISMAKELSMIQRTEKGKQARKYFIECERKVIESDKSQLPGDYLSALKALVASEEEKQQLQLENNYKQEVIQGFTDNISISDKRSILNKVIRKGGKYKERYSALYQTYKDTYHIDIKKDLRTII